MDDLREMALSTLLARHEDDSAAWSALQVDGWTDMLSSPPLFDHLEDAVVAVSTLARLRRDVGLLPHLVGSASLARVGEAVAGPIALGIDAVRRPTGEIEVSALGLGTSETLVIGPLDGALHSASSGSVGDVLRDMPASVDEIRDIARVRIASSDVRLITDSPAVIMQHEALAALLLAADSLALAEWAVERTFEHVRSREVFGAMLSTRQVVRHRLVDMTTTLALVRRLVEVATLCQDETSLWRSVWAAKCLVGRRLPWVTDQAVQLHGGMGFTWEAGVHFAFRRARATRALLGGPERAALESLMFTSDVRSLDVQDWSRRDPAGRARGPALTGRS